MRPGGTSKTAMQMHCPRLRVWLRLKPGASPARMVPSTQEWCLIDSGDQRRASLRRIDRGTALSHRGCGGFARPLASLHRAGPRSPKRAHAILRTDPGRSGRAVDRVVEARISTRSWSRNDWRGGRASLEERLRSDNGAGALFATKAQHGGNERSAWLLDERT